MAQRLVQQLPVGDEQLEREEPRGVERGQLQRLHSSRVVVGEPGEGERPGDGRVVDGFPLTFSDEKTDCERHKKDWRRNVW